MRGDFGLLGLLVIAGGVCLYLIPFSWYVLTRLGSHEFRHELSEVAQDNLRFDVDYDRWARRGATSFVVGTELVHEGERRD